MENRTKRNQAIHTLVSDFERKSQTGRVSFREESSYFQLIDFFQDELQVKKALEVVNHALSQYTYRSEFYIIKAKLLLNSTQLDEALHTIEQAENFASNDLDLVLLKAKILGAKGAIVEALSIVEPLQESATSSELKEISLCQAYLYEWMGDYESMFQELKSVLIQDPKNQEALERIWIAIELSKNFEESILLHNVILNQFPYNYLAWFNLGHAHACLGEYEDAIFALEYSFIINTDFESGYLDCAELCFQLNKFEKALQIYEEAEDQFGPDSENLMNIAHCQFQLNRYDESRSNLKTALTIDPYNDEVYFLLANCYMVDRNWDRAIEALDHAIDLDQEREEYYQSMARCYLHKGDLNLTKINYCKAARKGLEQSCYWEEYISFLIKSGSIKEAESAIALAEDHTYSDRLLCCKSVIYFNTNRKTDALILLEEALAENKENYKFYFDLAPELKNNKEILSAVKYFADVEIF